MKRRGNFIDVGRGAIPERVSDSPAKLNQVAHVVHLDKDYHPKVNTIRVFPR